MTLVETLIAMGVAGVVLATVMSFTAFSARSFAAMGNYVDLNGNSRIALDRMSKDIRQADYLSGYTADSLVFQMTDPDTAQKFTITYTYDPAAHTVTRTLGDTSEILLKGCNYCRFDLFQRNPSLDNGGDLVPLISTNQPELVKAINITWACTRTVLGKVPTTENVQSARVVIRKD